MVSAILSKFGFNLLSSILLNSRQETYDVPNIVVSPLSVASSLSLAALGAQGSTREGILKAIGVDGVNAAGSGDMELAHLFSGMNQRLTGKTLPSDQRVENFLVLEEAHKNKYESPLELAVSVWSESFRESYAAVTAAVGGEVVRQAPKRESINSWAKDKTHGKIEELFKDELRDPLAVLLSVVYFKDAWAVPFLKSSTQTGFFYSSPLAERRHVHMMVAKSNIPAVACRQVYNYKHFKDDQLEAVAIPYKHPSFEAVIVLPALSVPLLDIMKTLEQDWLEIFEGMILEPGHVQFPRFSLEFSRSDLSPLLGSSLQVAQSPEADFGRMSEVAPGEVRLSHLAHAARLEVNERGTEGAAVAAAVISRSAPCPSLRREYFQLLADRPFVFMVVDRATGGPIFTSLVTEPLESTGEEESQRRM